MARRKGMPSARSPSRLNREALRVGGPKESSFQPGSSVWAQANSGTRQRSRRTGSTSRLFAVPLVVGGRLLRTVHYQHVDRGPALFQFQSVFLDALENARAREVG